MATRFPEAERARLRDERRRESQPVEELIERMSPRPDEVVADLGSGTGYTAVPLARRTARVVALDVQKGMLGAMCEIAPGEKNLFPVLAELPHLPLADESIDRVLIVNVLHEVDDRDLLVSETGRVLKRGGHASVIDFPRRETSSGPPLEERIDPDEAVDLFIGFRPVGRWDLMEYYQLELEKQ